MKIEICNNVMVAESDYFRYERVGEMINFETKEDIPDNVDPVELIERLGGVFDLSKGLCDEDIL